MKLKTVFHQDGKRYAEIHTDPKSDAIIVRTYHGDGRLIAEQEYNVVSMIEVYEDVNLWATI